MNNTKLKKMILRCVSILLILSSIVFGVTWKKGGYCIGDSILTSLGLKAWSDGTQGTHYTAIVSLIFMVVAFWVYSTTTENKLRIFRYFLLGLLVIIFLANIIF